MPLEEHPEVERIPRPHQVQEDRRAAIRWQPMGSRSGK